MRPLIICQLFQLFLFLHFLQSHHLIHAVAASNNYNNYSISSALSISFPSPSATYHHLCPHGQRSALLQFKQMFTIEPDASSVCDDLHFPQTSYPKTVSWNENETSDCCSWDGVTCDDLTGHVIGLDLSCSQLSGTIHPNSTLFQLSHLRQLNLAFNDFNSNPIPPAFGRFAGLIHLNLSFSLFSGSIPSEISHLSELISLDFSYGFDLRVEPRTFKMLLKNLTRLQELALSYVDISSVLPDSLMNLSSLTGVDLSYTRLRGTLPDNIFHLPNLQRLFLRGNSDLNGSLPKVRWSSASSLRELDLSYTNFSGKLPDSLGYLKSLNYLGLSHFIFSRPIANSLGNLTELRHLTLWQCNLKSEDLSGLSYFKKLTHLRLPSNNLKGEIPNVFAEFTWLEVLDLQGNNFSGGLPLWVANLTQLVSLDISSNALTGPFPSNMTGLQNLQMLRLYNNSLGGTIPSWLFTLPSLKHLNLGDNRLIGQIPEFQHNSQLMYLFIYDNELHGPVPQTLSNLVNLTYLYLSSNNLSGVVDLKILSNLKNLRRLDFSQNNLSVIRTSINSTLPNLRSFSMSSCKIEEFPDFLGTQENLKVLDLSDNKIHGPIPDWVGLIGKASLSYLNLSHNFLTGIKQLPWESLQIVDLHSNSLLGPLPVPPHSTSHFFISNNNLSGEIPSRICNAIFLEILDLSHNNLSGVIPRCLGNFSNVLSVLDLRSNKFQGTIPSTFAKDNLLRNLDLNGNQFEGPLPQSLTRCKSLEVLDLGNNKINDSFPHWLGSLPELKVLVLHSNRFHGPISTSETKQSFPKLRIVDLSFNNFAGRLPVRYFKKFQAMKNTTTPDQKYMGDANGYYQDSIAVTMKGFEIELERIFTLFTTIDLSSNNFIGEIPDVIGGLSSLKVLNLSHNNLTAHIPASLGNLTNLESLDLSSNQLNGTIPGQLTSMTFLAVLNLSRNHLDGPIPHGKQFDTFGNDSYGGNSGLCGPPLSKNCEENQAQGVHPPVIDQHEDDSDFKSGFTWKVVVMGYGCGLAFGLFIGCLMFLIGKPKFFVRLAERKKFKNVIRYRRSIYGQSSRRN